MREAPAGETVVNITFEWDWKVWSLTFGIGHDFHAGDEWTHGPRGGMVFGLGPLYITVEWPA